MMSRLPLAYAGARMGGLFAVLFSLVLAATASGETARPAVRVDFFYEPSCPSCARVEREVLPELETRLGNAVDIRRHDVTTEAGYASLMRYRKQLGIDSDASSLLIIDRRQFLAGLEAIRSDAAPLTEAALARRLAGEPPTAQAHEGGPSVDEANAEALAREQLTRTSLFGVALAGLVDGINPCAIATLVFLVSLLTALRVRGARLLAVGGAFCLATFLTYFAIGFGVLEALHSMAHFESVRRALEVGMAAVLLMLAGISLADAVRYRRSGNADSVALKLPDRASRWIRATMHRQFRRRNLIIGGFVAGALVTAVESVCTGQVYVPTLVYLIKVRQETGMAWGYLVLYNAMFLVPLLVAFALAWGGVETSRFLRFSRTNVAIAKLLLALLFLALAAAIMIL